MLIVTPCPQDYISLFPVEDMQPSKLMRLLSSNEDDANILSSPSERWGGHGLARTRSSQGPASATADSGLWLSVWGGGGLHLCPRVDALLPAGGNRVDALHRTWSSPPRPLQAPQLTLSCHHLKGDKDTQ